MKKALSLIFSGIIMLPAIAWGASAVKTLGGAGTYTGVTSVGTGATGAKTGTRVLRAGSVRTVPAVKSVSTTSASSNGNSVTKSGTATTVSSGNSQNRMSIGKYLSGTGVVSASSGSSTSGVPSRRADELEQEVQALRDKLEDLEDAGYITQGDIDAIIENYLKDGYVTEEELGDYVKSDAIKDFLTADALNGYLTDADLNGYAKSTDLEGFLTADALNDYLTDADLNGYAKSADLEGFLTADALDDYLANADLNGYAKSADLEAFLTDAKLAEKGFLTNDEANPYIKSSDLGTQVASQVSAELLDRDLVTNEKLGEYAKATDLDGLVTSEGLNTSLNNYVQNDTLEQLAYRSYVDTIVNNLNTTQADVNNLSQQIQNIQVSNMPDVPTCVGDEPCTYMLLDNGGETKTWQQMSVVDEFNADQMN